MESFLNMNDTKCYILIGVKIPDKNDKLSNNRNEKIKPSKYLDTDKKDTRIEGESYNIDHKEENILPEPIFSFTLKGNVFMNEKCDTCDDNKAKHRRKKIKPSKYVRHYIENNQIGKSKKASDEEKSN